jgi:hypothetical protein
MKDGEATETYDSQRVSGMSDIRLAIEELPPSVVPGGGIKMRNLSVTSR